MYMKIIETTTAPEREDTSALGRDSVGMYLAEIGRTPLLDAAREVELAKTIEAGLYARHLLSTDAPCKNAPSMSPKVSRAELEWLAQEG